MDDCSREDNNFKIKSDGCQTMENVRPVAEYAAGKNGTFSSICDGDLSGGLQKALDTFDAACKTFPPVR